MGTRMIDAVDLERYPIDDLDGPAAAPWSSAAGPSSRELGACDLPGFLSACRRADRAEIPSWDATPYRTETTHNIEFSGREHELADDDPLRIQVRSAKSLIAYDQIPGLVAASRRLRGRRADRLRRRGARASIRSIARRTRSAP